MWNEASAYLYKHIKIAMRWPGELVHLLVHPLISILSIGILAFFVITQGAPVETLLFAFVGVVTWNVFECSERITGYGIMVDIFNGCMKHSFTGRTGIWSFIVGNGLYAVISAITGFIIALLAGLFLFGFNLLNGGLYLLANLAFVFIFGVGVGLMLNSLIVSRGAKIMALVWILPGLTMIFSGVFYPPEILPPVVQEISLSLPATHSLVSLRAAFNGLFDVAFYEMLIGGVMSLAAFAIGVVSFRYGIMKGKENGVITKY
jgi:ABC-2 type transport system permease protein